MARSEPGTQRRTFSGLVLANAVQSSDLPLLVNKCVIVPSVDIKIAVATAEEKILRTFVMAIASRKDDRNNPQEDEQRSRLS